MLSISLGFGGFCALMLHGAIEIVFSYEKCKLFFLSPAEMLFLYGFLGYIGGLIFDFSLALIFRKKNTFNITPHFLTFTVFLYSLGFIDTVLYIIRNYPNYFYILFPITLFITVCLFVTTYVFLSKFLKDKSNSFPFTKFFYKRFLVCFFIFFFMFITYPTSVRYFYSPSKQQLPNIVLLVLDNTRADFLGCYGYKNGISSVSPISPNIDKIAKEGVLFEQFYSNAEWTLPSHASLFTGLYPSTHNVIGTKENSNSSLSGQFHTIGEYLQEKGYNTVGFSDNLFVSSTYGFNQGFSSFTEMFDTCPPYIIFRVVRKFFVSSFFTKYKAPTTDMILAGFKMWFFCQDTPDKPFFAFFNLMDCHLLWNPPPPFRERFFKTDSSKNISHLTKLATVDTASKYLAEKISISPKEFSGLKKLYAGEVSYLDNRLGKLFEFLKKNNAWKNTLLIITSDHGENIGEHDLMFHCFSAHNTLTHTPLIFHFPKSFPADKRITVKAETVDILPTILQIANIEPKNVQGSSLLKIILGEENKERTVFTEVYGKMNIYRWIKNRFPKKNWSKFGQNYKACYFGNFKYIISSTGKEFLINLLDDFEEKTNLVNKMPEKTKEGRKIIKEFIKKTTPLKYRFKGIPLSEEQKKILNSVGYTQ